MKIISIVLFVVGSQAVMILILLFHPLSFWQFQLLAGVFWRVFHQPAMASSLHVSEFFLRNVRNLLAGLYESDRVMATYHLIFSSAAKRSSSDARIRSMSETSGHPDLFLGIDDPTITRNALTHLTRSCKLFLSSRPTPCSAI